jgi:hypothetical protein
MTTQAMAMAAALPVALRPVKSSMSGSNKASTAPAANISVAGTAYDTLNVGMASSSWWSRRATDSM